LSIIETSDAVRNALQLKNTVSPVSGSRRGTRSRCIVKHAPCPGNSGQAAYITALIIDFFPGVAERNRVDGHMQSPGALPFMRKLVVIHSFRFGTKIDYVLP
jgi:hypothetical protein